MHSISVQFTSREDSRKTMIHQLMKKQRQCNSHKSRGQEAAPQLVGTVTVETLGLWAHTPAEGFSQHEGLTELSLGQHPFSWYKQEVFWAVKAPGF